MLSKSLESKNLMRAIASSNCHWNSTFLAGLLDWREKDYRAILCFKLG
ncbi:hypothetical protein [Scytonema sp. PRP1]